MARPLWMGHSHLSQVVKRKKAKKEKSRINGYRENLNGSVLFILFEFLTSDDCFRRPARWRAGSPQI
ncbi:MAG: hypothetical protein JRE63_12480 [Deltaproteobacteria bacterium]|jgi:hypothetical protein|nr:hypothetical protein [Deltaproteobacteria bacterium]